MNFNSFEFHPKVAAGITAEGYKIPTPIQTQAIPAVMEGKDVMGLAQTGTGKTAAFVLPILNRLMRGKGGRLRALVIAPTRELAEQINDSFVSLGRHTNIRSTTVYGGVGINPQIQKLKRGTEIVVACPGRLLDHIGQGTIKLSELDVLVLDEADQMFDMGFFPTIRRIIGHLPYQRQTLLFSATMPTEIRRLVKEVQKVPVTVQVDTIAPAATVSHALYPVSQHLKAKMLFKLLNNTNTESVLVFTRTKHRAKRLGEQLTRAGHNATSLQGNLSQSRRQAALNGFKDGTFQVLVATDIAARGIDVNQVSHVINFDIPNTTEAYIHRIGRTGRASCHGEAFTLVTDDDRSMVRSIERALGKPVVRHTFDDFNYDAPPPAQNGNGRRPGRKPVQGRQRAVSSNNSRHQNRSSASKPSWSKPSQRKRPKTAGR